MEPALLADRMLHRSASIQPGLSFPAGNHNKVLLQQASIGENLDCKDVAGLQLPGMSGIRPVREYPSRSLREGNAI